ncbi:MAG: T9SS type A sorting domain-containing protein, partial [Bacteroidota bacterium]
FEQSVDPGNPVLSFATDFGYVSCPVNQYNQLWGKISILSTPEACYPNWNGYDHTFGDSTGRMLMVDFPANNTIGFQDIWGQTVNVQAGATYCFGAWYRNLNVGQTAPEPSFRYVIDGNLVGISPDLPANGAWEYFAFTYTVPVGVSTLNLSIQNATFGGGGNDLAIDDIEFREIPAAGQHPTAMDDEVYHPAGIGSFPIFILANDMPAAPGGNIDPDNLHLLSTPSPMEGSITLDATGMVQVTPYPGFIGSSSFAYEICDSSGCCSQAIVRINLDQILPVSIEAFHAFWKEDQSHLSWFTSGEANLAGFEVERSVDQQTYEAIGSLEAGATAHLPGYYRFEDVTAAQLGAEVIYYRIKEIQTDGQTAYSSLAEVRPEPTQEVIQAVYPNPVVDQVLNLEYHNLNGEPIRLEMYSLDGHLLRKQLLVPQAYWNHEKIDVADFATGIYLLRLSNSAFQQQHRITILP